MPETTLRTTGIDHVVLYVSDIGRSKKFYLDVLGMSVADEPIITVEEPVVTAAELIDALTTDTTDTV